jgi:hypothetical protein
MTRPKLRMVPLLNTADLSGGPINLSNGFSIRDITGLLTPETFGIFQRKLSEEDRESLLAWDLSVVHEFRSDLVIGQEEVTSEYMMRFVVAALRWLQPTATTDTWFVQGFVSPEGPIKVPTFSAQPGAAITAPQFSSRPQHIFLEDFEVRRGLANPQAFGGVTPFLPEFERIVRDMIGGRDSYLPIVMATRLSEQAYLDFDPRLRLLKRVMALEALFSSDRTYGKKALVPRVQKFVGGSTPIYAGANAPYTVATTIGDLLTLRNKFAHGDVVPPAFLAAPPDPSVASTNVKSYADVLREASTTMVRASMLRILQDGLLDTFSDKTKMEKLF